MESSTASSIELREAVHMLLIIIIDRRPPSFIESGGARRGGGGGARRRSCSSTWRWCCGGVRPEPAPTRSAHCASCSRPARSCPSFALVAPPGARRPSERDASQGCPCRSSFLPRRVSLVAAAGPAARPMNWQNAIAAGGGALHVRCVLDMMQITCEASSSGSRRPPRPRAASTAGRAGVSSPPGCASFADFFGGASPQPGADAAASARLLALLGASLARSWRARSSRACPSSPGRSRGAPSADSSASLRSDPSPRRSTAAGWGRDAARTQRKLHERHHQEEGEGMIRGEVRSARGRAGCAPGARRLAARELADDQRRAIAVSAISSFVPW